MRNRHAATQRGAVAPGATLALLWIGISIALWGFYYQLSSYPPYVDYDTATIGIFTNNITWHGQYDYHFRDSFEFQTRYRGFWAAHFLPVSVVLAALQSMFGVSPEAVGDLLQLVTLALGLVGCLCAAALARRREEGSTWTEGAFLVGLTASFPPFLLYLRSDIIHVLSFALFWSGLLLLVRFLESRRLVDGCLLAAVVAMFVLQPAPALPALVLVALFLAARAVRRQGWRAVFHGTAALSLVLAAASYQAIPTAAAWSCGADAADVRARAARFVALRSGRAFSPEYRDPALLGKKLTKLVHQHFVFARDDLGDPTREDDLWTLPHPHPVWILLLPLAFAGWIRSLRERDDASVTFTAPLAGVLAVMLFASFPEGRYLLPVVPCYAYGVLQGTRWIVTSGATRRIVQAVILAAMGIGSLAAVRGEYNTSMLETRRASAGLRESVSLIRRLHGGGYGLDKPLILGHPPSTWKDGLYLSMLTNQQYRRLDPNDFVQLADQDNVLFAIAGADDRAANQTWRARGFRAIGEVTDAPSQRRFVVYSSR